MKSDVILGVLEKVGAVITGSHIVYTSGKHGTAYINKDALYPHTIKTSAVCSALAKKFEEDQIDVVIAPAIGGVILSQWVAYHLSKNKSRTIFGVYAEKSEDGSYFVIRRGYEKFVKGKNVLVVEDILNTGGSAQKVVEAVRQAGGNVIGVGALCNRGGVTAKSIGDVPRLEALVNIKLDAWEEENCPLCRDNIPINTEVGKGKEFLAKKGK